MMMGTAAATLDAANQLPLKVEVLELTVQAPTYWSLRRFSGRISLRLRLTRHSSDALVLRSDQLRFLCDGSECRSVASIPDSLLPGARQLESGGQLEGWVSFTVKRPSMAEPEMRLVWAVDEAELNIDINQALRNLIDVSEERIGPRNALAVLTIHRTIDLLTIWVLGEHLKALKADRVERVVLDARLHRRARLPTNVTSWLASAQRRTGGPRPRMLRMAAPVQFGEFHVSGFQHQSNPYQRSMHKNKEQAVAAALESVYRRLPADEAVAGLWSSHPGIRRAALSSSIDRLTEEQLRHALDLTRSVDPRRQRLVLEHLDRVSSPVAVSTLRELLLEYLSSLSKKVSGTLEAPESIENPLVPESSRHLFRQPVGAQDGAVKPALLPDTAVVAALTLVRCIAPGTEAAISDVWQAAANDDELQSEMIRETLRTRDHRWVRMVSDFAVQQLDRISGRQQIERDPGDDPKTTDSKPSVAADTTTHEHDALLPDVLRFLQDHDPSFVALARERLLDVGVTRSQDVLLAAVLDSDLPEDARLASVCISQRLAEGTVTSKLLAGIRAMPDSDWTDRLLQLHQDGEKVRHRRAPVLIAAVRCATDAQLNRICDDFLSFDRSARVMLLQQFVAIDHPRSLELFETALDSDETFSNALRLIPQNANPQMLQLLLDRLEPLLTRARATATLDGPSASRARQLLAQVGVFDHPEARRMVNLCRISPIPELRKEATDQISRSISRSRTRRRLRDLWEMKREHNYEKALDTVTQLIQQDPFFADFFLFRSALYLRSDNVEPALADALTAAALSPGDVTTESTIALAYVRTGELKRGLEDAESVLSRVPEKAQSLHMWTLYNTACVYGRAIQQSATSREQQHFLDRAMELFVQSVDAGLDDEQHVRNDPDLVTLHNHPDWNRLIQQIADNEAGQR